MPDPDSMSIAAFTLRIAGRHTWTGEVFESSFDGAQRKDTTYTIITDQYINIIDGYNIDPWFGRPMHFTSYDTVLLQVIYACDYSVYPSPDFEHEMMTYYIDKDSISYNKRLRISNSYLAYRLHTP